MTIETPAAPAELSDVATFEASLDEAAWEASNFPDPNELSDAQPQPDWDDSAEREARAQAEAEPAAEAEQVEVATEPAAEPAAEVEPTTEPTPQPDRLDRLAELVEKMVTAAPRVADPPAEPAKPAEPEIGLLELFVERSERGDHCRRELMRRYGYGPESLSDPHAINNTYFALQRHVEAQKIQESLAEISAWKAEMAAEQARAAEAAKVTEASQTFTKALTENFGEIPEAGKQARAILEAAVHAAVKRGVEPAAAVKSVIDTFGALLPPKPAPKPVAAAKPAPQPDPKAARRDAAIAATSRAPRSSGRVTINDLRRFEGGGGWAN